MKITEDDRESGEYVIKRLVESNDIDLILFKVESTLSKMQNDH